MVRGKFVTGEKLREYRDYCHLQGTLLAGAAASTGFALSSGIVYTPIAAVVLWVAAVAHYYVNSGDFEKIEDAIEDSRGDTK